MWTKFNDYPVARSTLEDIPMEVREHLNLYLYRHGDEIVYRTILQNIALVTLRRGL